MCKMYCFLWRVKSRVLWYKIQSVFSVRSSSLFLGSLGTWRLQTKSHEDADAMTAALDASSSISVDGDNSPSIDLTCTEPGSDPGAG